MRLSSSPHREGSTVPVLAPSGQDMAAAAETAPRLRKSLRDVVIGQNRVKHPSVFYTELQTKARSLRQSSVLSSSPRRCVLPSDLDAERPESSVGIIARSGQSRRCEQ